MTAVVNAYLNKKECSVKECVYHVLLEQWLKRTFPGVIFANNNVSEKGFRIFLNKNENMVFPKDSEDIFK